MKQDAIIELISNPVYPDLAGFPITGEAALVLLGLLEEASEIVYLLPENHPLTSARGVVYLDTAEEIKPISVGGYLVASPKHLLDYYFSAMSPRDDMSSYYFALQRLYQGMRHTFEIYATSYRLNAFKNAVVTEKTEEKFEKLIRNNRMDFVVQETMDLLDAQNRTPGANPLASVNNMDMRFNSLFPVIATESDVLVLMARLTAGTRTDCDLFRELIQLNINIQSEALAQIASEEKRNNTRFRLVATNPRNTNTTEFIDVLLVQFEPFLTNESRHVNNWAQGTILSWWEFSREYGETQYHATVRHLPVKGSFSVFGNTLEWTKDTPMPHLVGVGGTPFLTFKQAGE